MKRVPPVLLFLVFLPYLVFAGGAVVEVDFLKPPGLKVNGAGPILVRADPARDRVILANTYTSSISLIDGRSRAVENIPIQNRIPQYLKDEALAIDGKMGNLYVIGEKSLQVVFPAEKRCLSFPTGKQMEMVAVDEKTGDAVLVGRESRDILFFRLQEHSVEFTPLFDREEKLANLNATPPPPIRKVVWDAGVGRVFAADGYTNTLFSLSAGDGKLISRRALPLKKGERWHFAGYNEKTHFLYVVIETGDRKVIQAAKIDCMGENYTVVDLPELTEGVGIAYSAARDEVYIPYDNHPIVHVVDFKAGSRPAEVKVPAFGNDASAVDEAHQILYVASWAYGEIDVIDLRERKLVRRVRDAGVLPHTFSMDLDPANGRLYVPLGATAVNGSHGAAVTVFDVSDFSRTKVRTGWAPVDLVPLEGESSFLVFNSEDEFAQVFPDGTFTTYRLPFDYPRTAVPSGRGTIYLSYGPHQSYWPVVYIWGAKDGILEIEPKRIETSGGDSFNFQFFDRRIARLAQQIVTDAAHGLWALQNSWGKEKLFLAYWKDGIRLFAPAARVEIDSEIERETAPRILRFDGGANRLYVVKTGEKDDEPGTLFVLNPETGACERTVETGLTPTDLAFDDGFIYVSNFDSNTVSRIGKKSESVTLLAAGEKPLKLALAQNGVYVINHNENTLQRMGGETVKYKIPYPGRPDNLFEHQGKLILTSHDSGALRIIRFDPETETFALLHEARYPYGETTLDTNNSSFYTRGQFGDSIFEINRIKADGDGRLWVTDFLSGRLFILNPGSQAAPVKAGT
jgi:DNA-binding beta-propeller fold protein YncE